MSRLRFVQNDFGGLLTAFLSNPATGVEIDLSNPSTVVRFHFVPVGQTLPATVVCDKVVGKYIERDDGTYTTDASGDYAVPGKGGGVLVTFAPDDLAVPGKYEGEFETTYPDGSTATVYGKVKFSVRAQIG